MPEGQFELFAYDAVGNMTTHTNFAWHSPNAPASTKHITDFKYGASAVNRHITDFRYDILNRLTKKFERGSENSPWVTFTYNSLGQRLTMTSFTYGNEPWSHEVSYQYDAFNRLQGKTGVSYAYDLSGNVKTINSVDYKYDALNRLTNVNHSGALTSYEYDPVGNLKTVKLPNGVESTYNYDTLNRLTLMNTVKRISLTQTEDRASFDYATAGLSGTGKRLGVDEVIYAATPINRAVRYLYDHRYRLTEEKHGVSADDPKIGYAYDNVGNRQQRSSTVTGVPAHPDYNYNANDWLIDYGAESIQTTFDENGNTLRGEVTPAQTADDEYDYENRLIKRTIAGRTIQLFYDGDGHRVRKVIKENDVVVKTTDYLIVAQNPTGYAQALQEQTLPWEPGALRTYVYGLDLISTSVDSTPPRYYGYDGHGSVRFLTDETGSITDTYTYDAFGNIIGHTPGDHNALTPNNYLYAGEQFDPDLGLYYNRARYYNPQTGRFWTVDTFEGEQEEPLSLHKYAYAHANPVNGIDPSGHESIFTVVNNFATLTYLRSAQFAAAHPVYIALGATVVAIAFPQLEAIPPGHPSPLDEMGQVGRIIRQGIAKGLAKVAMNNHHPLPKFLGGDRIQEYIRIPRNVHRAFHKILHERLHAKGFPLGGLGGRGNSASDWADYFRANPGSQDKAFEAVLEAARAIDVSFGDEIAETGTTMAQAVWKMVMEGKFTQYP